jgi:hypothetical protein
MAKKKKKEQNPREVILNLLTTKSALKQDIIEDTEQIFNLLKKVLSEEVNALKEHITDPRIRMQYDDKNRFEAQVFVGSDALLFHMHNNIFLLPQGHPFWDQKYMKDNPNRGYFGIIYIYNFLAQSLIQGRSHDLGYLIGRIFVNSEGHFFMEGKGPLGDSFKEIGKVCLCDEILREVVQTSFTFALNFDLLTPPYEIVAQINVQQAIAISDSLSMQTGKRLGFKFEDEKGDFF